MKTRAKPLGFWKYPAAGAPTPSKEWMTELLAAQRQGNELGDRSRLNLDAGQIPEQYPKNAFPGHAAWLDWPWKLHRIEAKNGKANFELYNLKDDPQESSDLAVQQPDRVKSMRSDLQKWLASVVSSLNGKDY